MKSLLLLTISISVLVITLAVSVNRFNSQLTAKQVSNETRITALTSQNASRDSASQGSRFLPPALLFPSLILLTAVSLLAALFIVVPPVIRMFKVRGEGLEKLVLKLRVSKNSSLASVILSLGSLLLNLTSQAVLWASASLVLAVVSMGFYAYIKKIERTTLSLISEANPLY
ncbi:MAG: hypothetical protein ABWK01_01310 [Infirmifilum sp.]